ncbi:DUF6798 domain-containing protein [Thalassotalea aquiviva]|uniref:DUF6798 domain-containing protein n=1 Tax=Thalassotalea aquiviva TaxID=3242415 RepID=UPI00352ABCF3
MMKFSWWGVILAILTLFVALSFGFTYGESNQNTYLINALQIIDPSLFVNDWFASKTVHYHDLFHLIILIFNFSKIPLNWGTAVLEVITKIISIYVIYMLIRSLTPRYANYVFLFVLTVILIDRTQSVGHSYIYSSIFQPSSIGSLFTILGLFFFTRQNYFYSGACLAFGGLFHINFLLIAFVYLGVAHLVLGRENFFNRCILQFSLMLMVFLWKLPFLMSMIDSQYADKAGDIFLFIRSPHHYNPSHYSMDFLKLLGWGAIGFSGLLIIDKKSLINMRIFALYWGLTLTLFFSYIFTAIVFTPVISKLFFWRIAPFWELLSLIIFLSAFFEVALSQNLLHKGNRRLLYCAGLFYLGCILYFRHMLYFQDIYIAKVLVLLLFIMPVSILFVYNLFEVKASRGYKGKLILLSSVLSILVASINTINKEKNNSLKFSLKPLQSEEIELYDWISLTSIDSVFLTPPQMYKFRFWSRRAIIVDWKSTPIDPNGVVEWYSRMEDVSGIKGVKTRVDATTGFNSMTEERIKQLKNKYHFNYLVMLNKEHKLTQKQNNDKLPFPVVFTNNKFSVYLINV